MAQSRCPVCGCEQFYVQDPDDEYEIYEFECRDRQVCFGKGVSADDGPKVSEDMEVYCNACAWHDKFHKLK